MQNPDYNEGRAVNSHVTNLAASQLCGINCSTTEVLKVHLTGQKHQKNLKKRDDANEDRKVVNLDGCKRKTKRVASDDDLEAKREKIDRP